MVASIMEMMVEGKSVGHIGDIFWRQKQDFALWNWVLGLEGWEFGKEKNNFKIDQLSWVKNLKWVKVLSIVNTLVVTTHFKKKNTLSFPLKSPWHLFLVSPPALSSELPSSLI